MKAFHNRIVFYEYEIKEKQLTKEKDWLLILHNAKYEAKQKRGVRITEARYFENYT
jgi:hypothetical protein